MLRLPDGRFVVPGNRWDLLDGVQPGRWPAVSVIVPYYQAQSRLDLVLAALQLQSYPHDLVEVIVADDGSDHAPDLRVLTDITGRVVRQADHGFRAAAARNLGARAATGTVLCFLDADTVPEPAYLTELLRLPALTPDALVTGRRRHTDLTDWTPEQVTRWLTGADPAPAELTEPGWLVDEHSRSDNLLRLSDTSYRFVISAVLACSAELFTEIGGFDESMTSYGGEDWELAHRALCAGAVLAHVPTAVAWHDGPDWAERGDAAGRRREKNAETLALESRIPALRRHNREWTGRPAVVVELGTTDEEPAAVLVAVRHLLTAAGECGVWLTGPAATGLKELLFPDDPRVGSGPPPASVRASALVLATMDRPLKVDRAVWDRFADSLYESGGFRWATADGTLSVTSGRAAGRVRRWSGMVDGHDLLGELFGRRDCSGPDVTPVPREPDLAYELARIPSVRRS